MLVIYLPGFSGQYNGPEMHEIADYLQDKGVQVHATEWPHWSDPEIEFNVDNEVQKVWELINKESEDGYVIIGKSIGTYVAIKLLSLHPEFSPQKMLLMGVPVASLEESQIREYPSVLAKLTGDVMIIQNELDPFGSAAQLKDVVAELNIELVIKPGNNTHAYVYAEDVYNFVERN